MKRLIIIFCICDMFFITQAQPNLFSLISNGGSNGTGTIVNFRPTTNTASAVLNFDGIPANPSGNLVQANDGKLYGMTQQGGSSNGGVIFSYDPLANTYLLLKNFNKSTGYLPFGSLMQSSDGKLYGMTSGGGTSDRGVIFSYNLATANYTVLKNLDNTTGDEPVSNLIQASDGKLYGMTQNDGGGGYGGIFSYDPISNTFSVLRNFDQATGWTPLGSLMQASDGKLYGMTYNGSVNLHGVLFSYDIVNNNYSVLKIFDPVSGESPSGNLMQATDGKLYGMTGSGGIAGGGTLFSYNPVSTIFLVLQNLGGAIGANPQGSLMQSIDGKLYGMTGAGGSNNDGVIFSYDLASNAYSVLKNFNNAITGGNSWGDLIQATNGKLYGMTFKGGNNKDGVVFSYDPVSTNYNVIKDFSFNATGASPQESLVYAKNGKLYGMANVGGANGYGVLFSYDPGNTAYTVLKNFDNTTGSFPYNGLIQANDGKLYGMTTYGGSNGGGVIFSYDTVSNTYSVLNNFYQSIGFFPYGSLIQATDGKLYGVTAQGGTNNSGVIFSYDPVSTIYSILKNFDNSTGGNPASSLIQVADGRLYGITGGAIFSYDPISTNFSILKNFDNTTGTIRPLSGLIQATDGNLYGITQQGGMEGYGTLFSLDPVTSDFTVLTNFDNTVTGGYPYGKLVQAIDGKLYGMTSAGGSYGYGVIFSWDPSNSSFAKLKDLDVSTGDNPQFGNSFIELSSQSGLPITLISFSASKSNHIVALAWQTSQELNTTYFVIQRSTNGTNFSSIGKVTANGNSTTVKNYFYKDLEPLIGPNFYRLKTIDADGKFTYSKIAIVKNDGKNSTFRIYPNPANDILYIKVNGGNDFETLQVFDASGSKLREEKIIINGNTSYPLNIKDLPKGVYNLSLKSKTISEHQKFVKR